MGGRRLCGLSLTGETVFFFLSFNDTFLPFLVIYGVTVLSVSVYQACDIETREGDARKFSERMKIRITCGSACHRL